MLRDSDLGKDLWGKALSAHVHIHNQCPSRILLGNSTPYEKVFGHAPSIRHLRIFISKCFIKIPDEIRSKLDDKAKECRLIGFEGDSIYVVVDSDRKKLRSRNVIFVESQSSRNEAVEPPIEFPSQTAEATDDNNNKPDEKEETPGRRTRSEVWGTDPTRRSKRISNRILITTVDNTPAIKNPKTYREAVESPEGPLWKEAMNYELSKLKEMNTWSAIDKKDIPNEAQILPGMWVHLVKTLESGEQRFRSQWVVRGDKQKSDLPLSDTFTPISRITLLQILLALATVRDMRIFAWDIDSAYLHGKIQHDIYVDFPNGYEVPGKVGKLNKALYSLPKAAHVWHEDLEEKLKLLEFIPLKRDTGVFLNASATGFTVVDMHMDEGTGICSSKEELKLRAGIQKFYKIKEKDMSKPFKVLGILVMRNTHQGSLKISQPEYIESMLQRYGMSDCNPVTTPIDKGSHLQNGD